MSYCNFNFEFWISSNRAPGVLLEGGALFFKGLSEKALLEGGVLLEGIYLSLEVVARPDESGTVSIPSPNAATVYLNTNESSINPEMVNTQSPKATTVYTNTNESSINPEMVNTQSPKATTDYSNTNESSINLEMVNTQSPKATTV